MRGFDTRPLYPNPIPFFVSIPKPIIFKKLIRTRTRTRQDGTSWQGWKSSHIGPVYILFLFFNFFNILIFVFIFIVLKFIYFIKNIKLL